MKTRMFKKRRTMRMSKGGMRMMKKRRTSGKRRTTRMMGWKKNRKMMNAELDRVLVKKTSAEWIEALNRAGVPSGPIYNIKQVFEDPQVQHLGLAQPVRHPERGEIRVQSLPAALSRMPTSP